MNRDSAPCPSEPGLQISEFTVPADRDGYAIRVRSYRPERVGDRALPLLVYFHGGGWAIGSLETDDLSCRELARDLDLVILNVEYRLAPEFPFPVGFEDALSVVKWSTTAAAATRLKVDLAHGFLVGGTSAGCNFAVGMAHAAQEADWKPKIAGLVLLAGSVVDERAIPDQFKDRILSAHELTTAPGLSKEVVDDVSRVYQAPPHDKRRSPLLYESREGLAKKAFVVVSGWDPKRDEMLVYEELLRQDGVETKLRVYEGLPHGFWTVCRNMPTRAIFTQDFIAGVRWLLE